MQTIRPDRTVLACLLAASQVGGAAQAALPARKASTAAPAPRALLARLQLGGAPSVKRAQAVIERLRRVRGVRQTTVNSRTGVTVVRYDPARCKVADLIRALRASGFSARPAK